MRQQDEAEVHWGTDCQDNHSADEFHVTTQGRNFRVQPIHQPDQPDMLSVRTPSGLRPTLFRCQIGPAKFPNFDIS